MASDESKTGNRERAHGFLRWMHPGQDPGPDAVDRLAHDFGAAEMTGYNIGLGDSGKMRDALEELLECTAHLKRDDGKCSQLCRRCIIEEALT